MTEIGWEYVQEDRQLFRRSAGEALARLARHRWPRNTAKQVALAWGLETGTADNLIKGHTSVQTLSKAIAVEGWDLLAALGEAMTGRSYDDHLALKAEEARRHAERLEARREHHARLAALTRELDGARHG